MDFFILSKTIGALSDPGNVLVILLLLAVVIKLLAPKNYRPYSRALTMTVIVIMTVIMTVPVGYWAMHTLENMEPKSYLSDGFESHIGGIIVLGGSIDPYTSATHDQITMNGSIERLFEFTRLHRLAPNIPAVFTGGSGYLDHQDLKEADIINEFLVTQDIDPDRIIVERQSRNTYENALLSMQKLEQQGINVKIGKPWLLVTSGYHMHRSKKVFEKLGWPVIAHPVDFRISQELAERRFCLCFSSNLEMLNKLSHELVGLLIYDLSGRI